MTERDMIHAGWAAWEDPPSCTVEHYLSQTCNGIVVRYSVVRHFNGTSQELTALLTAW